MRLKNRGREREIALNSEQQNSGRDSRTSSHLVAAATGTEAPPVARYRRLVEYTWANSGLLRTETTIIHRATLYKQGYSV